MSNIINEQAPSPLPRPRLSLPPPLRLPRLLPPPAVPLLLRLPLPLPVPPLPLLLLLPPLPQLVVRFFLRAEKCVLISLCSFCHRGAANAEQ